MLRDECAQRGRRFEDLSITIRAGLAIRDEPGGPDRKVMQGSVDQIVTDLQRYAGLGVDTVLLESRYRSLDDMIETYETVARDIRPRI